MSKFNHLLRVLACLLLLSAIALRRSGKLFGVAPGHAETPQETPDFMETLEDGSVVIDTTRLGAQIQGFAGPTPLKIFLQEGVVQHIEALPNQDTPEFFSATEEDGFREQWYGKRPAEALAVQATPVTGATYSSQAFIQNVQSALAAYLAAEGDPAPSRPAWRPTPKFVCGMLVALAAAILPFFLKSKYYRMIQLILNVVVLGFWCGTFVSYTLMVKYLSQGIHGWPETLPLLLIALAFLYPLFGRKSHYCLHACPFGSLQEVVGKCTPRKIRLATKTLKLLEGFRKLLWAALVFTACCGLFPNWMDCEPFSAFLLFTKPTAALALALLFTLLSLFVQRPYCRFVCPTGSLLKFAENSK